MGSYVPSAHGCHSLPIRERKHAINRMRLVALLADSCRIPPGGICHLHYFSSCDTSLVEVYPVSASSGAPVGHPAPMVLGHVACAAVPSWQRILQRVI